MANYKYIKLTLIVSNNTVFCLFCPKKFSKLQFQFINFFEYFSHDCNFKTIYFYIKIILTEKESLAIGCLLHT